MSILGILLSLILLCFATFLVPIAHWPCWTGFAMLIIEKQTCPYQSWFERNNQGLSWSYFLTPSERMRCVLLNVINQNYFYSLWLYITRAFLLYMSFSICLSGVFLTYIHVCNRFQVKKKQFFRNFMTIILFGAVGTLISFIIISLGMVPNSMLIFVLFYLSIMSNFLTVFQAQCSYSTN